MFDYREYIPKSLICLREGYSRQNFLNDLFAGLTVGIITIPLAMAFAIASGVTPERGLYTSIIAGFLISLLGGSRVQIGGPTGAFVVIIYSVVQRHGYDGLAIATLIAGLILIVMGLARFGVILKFIPYPVITGFTTGIAVSIFSSQMKDFLGLDIESVPVDFISKWQLFASEIGTYNPWALGIASLTLGIIIILRKMYPRIPGAIIGVIIATAFVTLFELPMETIGSRFGDLPRTLPMPSIPFLSLEKIQAVFPDAITIALLGGIESLLSAVVADGMTGFRHRSNCELVGQGIANIGSILFGGIPATGAIARTTANVRMNAKTPISGIIHAITVLLMMLFFAPYVGLVPMAGLAAILVYVAWNMSELDHFLDILRGQKSDITVLVITFLTTVLIDLTVAVQVGVILSALLFLRRMSVSTTGKVCVVKPQENSQEVLTVAVDSSVTVFEIDGPFFFAVADILDHALCQLEPGTRVFILKMHRVPLIDATGIHALRKFHRKCHERGVVVYVSGLKEELRPTFKRSGIEELATSAV